MGAWCLQDTASHSDAATRRTVTPQAPSGEAPRRWDRICVPDAHLLVDQTLALTRRSTVARPSGCEKWVSRRRWYQFVPA
eukprot:2655305-Rhodomonas_salina.1